MGRPGPAPPVGRRAAHHPVFGRLLAAVSPLCERGGAAEHRQEQLAGIAGHVLEIGCGSGVGFAHYPRTVADVVAVEPEPYLRRLARRAATGAPVPVTVIDAVAEALPFADGVFDAAAASLVLCSVADPARAVAELHRVLRPGGSLHFYEHVRALGPDLARRQQRADRWLWPALAGGCHCSRDTLLTIRAAGFVLERIRAFSFGPEGMLAIISPHVIGVGVRPLATADLGLGGEL